MPNTRAAIALLALCWALSAPAAEPARVPWATPHVTGSPDPASPFELKRAYPKLTFDAPLDIEYAPGSDRLFVADRTGKIFSFPTGKADAEKADLFVDLREVVKDWKTTPNCRGIDLWGFVFHPKFEQNRHVYVFYALNVRGPMSPEPFGSRVSRFTVVTTNGVPRVDPASEHRVIEWQTGGHNGGCLKFSPADGCLYISTGDQSNPNPPDKFDTGQDISDLRSSILRIDVDRAPEGKTYAIPRDNPFVKTPGARPEVWCYGLRNPWRMSFDRATNRLWIADVGWELWESVFCAKPGMNCGWAWMEGPNPVRPNGKKGPTPVSPPTIALSHAESMSVTGGFVYRGKRFPDLVGHYVFGDWDTRRLFAAKLIGEGDQVEPHRTIAKTDQRIVSFAEDADGELLVLDNEGGGIFEIVRAAPPAKDARAFPRKLSETGLFADVAKQQPAPGVYPYAIKAPQYADGATAEHWVAVPGKEVVGWPTYEVFGRLTQLFPKDSVLVRTWSFSGSPKGTAPRKVETQLMHFDGRQWQGYGYRWREDQTDADLVPEAGDRLKLTLDDPTIPAGKRDLTWHFASRAQCLTCHNIHAGYVVGYHAPQLDVVRPDGTKQLAELRKLGLATKPYLRSPGSPSPPVPFTLVDPHDTAAPLAERARSYLHANCAHCHREHGGGTALIDLRKERSDKELRAIDAPPVLGTFGLDDAKVITPGDPARSVLLYRMAKTGSGRMPHIGSAVPDPAGVALVGKWIAEMTGPSAARGKTTYDDALTAAHSAIMSPPQPQSLHQFVASPTGALSVIHAYGPTHPMSKAIAGHAVAALPNLPPASRDLFDRFTGRDTAPGPKLGANFDRAALLALPGNPARGRDVFVNAAQCATCHTAGDVKGRDFGPDLSKIAAKYAKPDLLLHVAEPSKLIAEGFTVYDVETTEGDSYSGFLVAKTPTDVTLKDATLQPVHLKTADVKSMRPQALSSMPPGLLDNLEPQQAADLLEWLGTLK